MNRTLKSDTDTTSNTTKKLDLTSKGKKSTSWASQITKQIGVGPRLVSLKSSSSKSGSINSSATMSNMSSSVKTWGTTPSQSGERLSLQMLQQQQEAAERMQRQQRQMEMMKPKPNTNLYSSNNKPQSSLARLAASHEVANADFPTLKSVQLAGQMGTNSSSNNNNYSTNNGYRSANAHQRSGYSY